MKAKRAIYTILLILFSLVLVADAALWFLVSDGQTVSESETGFSFTPSEGMTFPSEGTLPEGMTFPGDGTFPSGGTLPEGMTRPESGSFPGGMSFPGADGGTEGSGRQRPSRSSKEEETEGTASLELPAWVPSQLVELLPLVQKARPYRIHFLIAAILGMALCILRLVFLNKKIRQQGEQQTDPISLRRVALWPAMLLLLGALVLVVILFPVNEAEEAVEGAVTNAQVLTGTVTEKDLTSFIQSAGSLAEQEAVSLEIPISVEIESVCVKNGDAVTAGAILAEVDKTSVMQAVASVHEALEEIDDQLQKAHDTRADSYLYAAAAGTVKEVYAQAGETVMDVMNEHGALMLLSLDGRMAVQVPAAESLSVGNSVTVTLPDGTALAGEVSFLEEGIATVTVVDQGYAIGTQVSVSDPNGSLLGSGSLYVHKALHVTGYLGTITRVFRSEGSTVYAGAPVISLSDTADLADYQALLQQRAEYEAELRALFELYEDGYVHAPCNGVVEGLSEDLAYASLSQMVTGISVRQLATGPADAEPQAYVHYVGEVLENTDGLLSLNVSAIPVEITDYSTMPALSGATMTGTYTIPGSSPIYLLDSGWQQISAEAILPGDKVLFTFDQEGSLVWVIVQHTAASVTPSPTPSPDGSQQPSGTPGPGENARPSPSSGTGGGARIGGGSIRTPSGKTGATETKKPAYTVAKQTLCTVTPQEKMLITVPIDELDVLSLALGQQADLYLDALPATSFTAIVTEIDPEGENSGGNTKYSVTLALDRQAQLYPGMNGTVSFPRAERQKVPTVPLAAVEEDGSRTVIYTAYDPETDQLFSPVEIQTGLSDGTDVELLAGLSLGDTYCYRYADSISYVTE